MDQLIYSLFLKKKFVKSVTQKGIVELTHFKMSKKFIMNPGLTTQNKFYSRIPLITYLLFPRFENYSHE